MQIKYKNYLMISKKITIMKKIFQSENYWSSIIKVMKKNYKR